MVYVSYKNPHALVFKKKAWDDASWPETPDTLVKNDNGLTKPYIGIDSDDNIYVVYRRDNAVDTTYGMEEIAYITSADGGATWSQPVRLSRENYDAGYVTLAPKIGQTGVDVLWRESYRPFVDDADTTTIMYGHIDLLGTAIRPSNNNVPKFFSLQQNFPNPFNPTTTIRYQLPHSGQVSLNVYNALGQKVAELINGSQQAGYYSVRIDARHFASGVYFYKLVSGKFVQMRKMLLLK
jgi:hypothetical protein